MLDIQLLRTEQRNLLYMYNFKSSPKILQEAYWSQRALQSGKMAFVDLLHSMQYLDRIFGHRQLTILQQVIVTSSYHCEKSPVVWCRNSQKSLENCLKRNSNSHATIQFVCTHLLKQSSKVSLKGIVSFLKKSLHQFQLHVSG